MDFEPQAFLMDKKKEIVILVGIVIVLFALYFWGNDLVSPKALEASFSKGSVAPGEALTLKVTVKNILEEEVHNASVTVTPESEVINVTNPTVVEEVIGVGSTRSFDFSLKPSKDATLGSYGVQVLFEFGGQEIKQLVHFRVDK